LPLQNTPGLFPSRPALLLAAYGTNGNNLS
jgi:hypothetical protein